MTTLVIEMFTMSSLPGLHRVPNGNASDVTGNLILVFLRCVARNETIARLTPHVLTGNLWLHFSVSVMSDEQGHVFHCCELIGSSWSQPLLLVIQYKQKHYTLVHVT